MKKKAVYHFEPIPGVLDGVTHLTIYSPGEWFDSPDYRVFVGGCGVGGSATLDGAKAYLLLKARMDCQRHIDRAKATILHYELCLQRLTDGLVPLKDKK